MVSEAGENTTEKSGISQVFTNPLTKILLVELCTTIDQLERNPNMLFLVLAAKESLIMGLRNVFGRPDIRVRKPNEQRTNR